MPVFQERLLQLGQWLKVNGDAIYSTQAYSSQNDSYSGNIWYTMAKTSANVFRNSENEVRGSSFSVVDPEPVDEGTMTVFAIILNNGTNAFTNIVGVTLGSISDSRIKSIVVLGSEKQEIIWKQSDTAPNGTDVLIPPLNGAPDVLQWAVALQLTLNKI